MNKECDLKLKPCPFCGSRAFMWRWNYGVAIQCNKFDPKHHLVQIEAIDRYYKDKRYITRSRTILSAICRDMKSTMDSLPSAQPEIKPIDYQDCANAMLRMWMDKVVTDGEYNRIMDKLNAFWRTRNERSD